MEQARFRAWRVRDFGVDGPVAAVVRPKGFRPAKGSGDQQLRSQQEVPVLMHQGVGGAASIRTDDGGPPVKRGSSLKQQLPGAQHPGVRGHKATKSVPREVLRCIEGFRT
jgi:hypothetical protein